MYKYFLPVLCTFSLLACDAAKQQSEETQTQLTHEEAQKVANTPPSLNEHLLWVYIDNGAVQCEKPGRPLEETKRLLIQRNIQAQASRCGTITGSMMMTLCGTKDLNIHLHQIPRSKLEKAQALGFQSVENIGHGGSKSYQFLECPK